MHSPLRLLSLDGGGVRGLSSLLILENLMQNIAAEEEALGLRVHGSNDLPKPCDYFDLIGGTSTGGIIAILLSRLKLDVRECIQIYEDLAKEVFKNDRSIRVGRLRIPVSGARFSGTVLEAAVKRTLLKYGYEADELMWDHAVFSDEANRAASPASSFTHETQYPECHHDQVPKHQAPPAPATTAHRRGLVVASFKNALETPKLFTTYDRHDRTTKIWEALRATSAAPTFFKEIQVGHPKVSYLDGGLGFNNPCAEIVRAARSQWANRPIGAIVSVGTGLPAITAVASRRYASWLPFGLGNDLALVAAVTGMATSTGRVHRELAARFECEVEREAERVYFRFDVDRGMSDVSLEQWMREDEIATHTQVYLRGQEGRVVGLARVLAGFSRNG